MFWFTGFIISVIAHTFWAGLRYNHLFYRAPRHYENGKDPVFAEGLVWSYVLISLGISLVWPISIPLYVIFKLGKRFNKENSTTNK